MIKRNSVTLFGGNQIRSVWDEDNEKWYFSIVDVVAVLTDNDDYQLARNYWKVLKNRLIKEGNEPDESKAKIEIRKVTMKDNEETALKGYAFATEEGPGELITGMIKAGFGDTKEILRAVRTREDFMEAATTINEESDDSDSGEMFDMRKLLEGMDVEEEDDQYAV